MTTSKLVSTVSYNTKEFLINKLNELVEIEIIEFYILIEHEPEADEKKKHFHVLLYPAKRIDTVKLRKKFEEYDPSSELPLCCLPFQQTKRFSDWYLYAIHSPIYLASKLESRKHIYNDNDLITNDYDYLHHLISEVDYGGNNIYLKMFEAQKKGVTFEQFIIAKAIPPQLINSYHTAWYMMTDFKLERNGHQTHEHVDKNSIIDTEEEKKQIEKK